MYHYPLEEGNISSECYRGCGARPIHTRSDTRCHVAYSLLGAEEHREGGEVGHPTQAWAHHRQQEPGPGLRTFSETSLPPAANDETSRSRSPSSIASLDSFNRPSIFDCNVFHRKVDVQQGGLGVGVPHHPLQDGKAYPRPCHVSPEGVPKTMGVGAAQKSRHRPSMHHRHHTAYRWARPHSCS